MTRREHIMRFMLLLVVGVLLLPLVQECTGFFSEKELLGNFDYAKKPKSSLGTWWKGAYQDSFELYQNENFGFRNDFVRLHNEIEFDCFKHSFANAVVIGKNNYLYDEKGIKTLFGDDYIGDDEIKVLVNKLKLLQDSLAKKNITLIVAIAPGKTNFYPEYVPDDLKLPMKKTNEEELSKSLANAQINYINYNQWFLQKKATSPYPLFPKTGIHWSKYGATLATDSLIRYIEKKRNIDMPSMIFSQPIVSDSMRDPDADIGNLLNLMFPIQPLTMAYPKYTFENNSGKAKVKMMVISDSFFWNMYDNCLAPKSFSEINFWSYNDQLYHMDGRPMEHAQDFDDCLETENSNVILIMASVPNLSGIGWGYIDHAYDYFVLKKNDFATDKMVRYYENQIRQDEGWLMKVKKKSVDQKISLDSMIHLDAIYMEEHAPKK